MVTENGGLSKIKVDLSQTQKIKHNFYLFPLKNFQSPTGQHFVVERHQKQLCCSRSDILFKRSFRNLIKGGVNM